jgi:hypothetical protein
MERALGARDGGSGPNRPFEKGHERTPPLARRTLPNVPRRQLFLSTRDHLVAGSKGDGLASFVPIVSNGRMSDHPRAGACQRRNRLKNGPGMPQLRHPIYLGFGTTGIQRTWCANRSGRGSEMSTPRTRKRVHASSLMQTIDQPVLRRSERRSGRAIRSIGSNPRGATTDTDIRSKSPSDRPRPASRTSRHLLSC